MSTVQMQVDIQAPLKRTRYSKGHKYERIEVRESVYDAMLRTFNEFNTVHPEIFAWLVKLAFAKMATKKWQVHKPPIRINMLWEVLRDDLRERGIKIGMSNNLKPFYTRLMMQRYPDLKRHMEIRNQFSAMKQQMTYTWIEVLVEKS